LLNNIKASNTCSGVLKLAGYWRPPPLRYFQVMGCGGGAVIL